MLHFRNLYKSFFSIVTTIKSKKKEKGREREAVCKCSGRKIEQELTLTWKQVISDFLFVYISKKKKVREKAENKIKACLLSTLSFHPSSFFHLAKD